MSMIKLSGGFTVVPEGTHIFKITAVNYKEAFGKLEITMQTKNGDKHIERFTLLKSDGTENPGAVKAFSYFARQALNDISADEIDPENLVGCYLECDVSHDTQPNKNKPGQTVTFVRLDEKRPASGFEGEAPVEQKAPEKKSFDLDDLLG